MSQPSTFFPHHEFNVALGKYVLKLRVRDKRNIYIAMRKTARVKTNSFLPHFGIFIADFTVWQILSDRPRRVPATTGKGSCRQTKGKPRQRTTAATKTAAAAAAAAAAKVGQLLTTD